MAVLAETVSPSGLTSARAPNASTVLGHSDQKNAVPVPFVSELKPPFAYLARARILDAQGQRAAARAYYERFLANYDAPVQTHRGLVEEALAALTRTSR